jgi:hypothetical protein
MHNPLLKNQTKLERKTLLNSLETCLKALLKTSKTLAQKRAQMGYLYPTQKTSR